MSAFDGFYNGNVPFDSHIAHQVDAITGEFEELNVDEAVHTVQDELHAANFDASKLIDNLLCDVQWESNVEEQLFIIFEGYSRDLALAANEIENEIIAAQRKVKKADASMLNDLDSHTEKLSEVRSAVDEVKTNFDRASEGAVRIGERLVSCENERRQIDAAMELINFISWFDKANPTLFSELESKSSAEIREVLPTSLQRKTFGEISQVMNDLKKVLLDINASDVQNAQKNVIRLSEALEEKLLSEFESAVSDLMDDPTNSILIETCRNLISWLHNYQNGAALHKRFIYCVVEKSIPQSSAATGSEKASNPTSAWSKISSGVKLLGTRIKDGVKDGVQLLANKENGENEGNDGENSSYDAQDSLSELFGTIGRVCQQQFSIIRDIFPQHVVAKITRILIQRIFNDSAFGIQSRVDAVLAPKPPMPQLPLPDYLDALANVREKLSALYLILLEYCSHPALMGMGSEGALTRVAAQTSTSHTLQKGKSFSMDAAHAAATILIADAKAPTSISSAVGTTASDALLDELNEKLNSDAEIKRFLEEQISGVLSSYLSDYFDKEMAHVRNQYVEGLRRVVDDDKGPSKVSAGTVLKMPRFKAENMRNIPTLVKTVANNYFVTNVISITTDSVMRMENIGRDDKKLPARIKELYIFQLGFLIDGVFFPYIQACTTMLLRSAVAVNKHSVLPPIEYIQALAAVYAGVSLLKKNFDDVFMSSMAAVPNLIVVCKEARRNSLKPLESSAKESMHSWTMCVILHMERTLTNTQTQSDYNPPRNGDSSMNGTRDPSAACDSICQSFMKVISTVQGYKADLIGIDLTETFWRPLGQQFIGTLLTHLRKQKISQEGAETLLVDLDEYLNIAQSMESPETTDMMICLKEIARVYAAPPEQVTKIVVENLRHLDTVIVLALVKARSDFSTRSSISHWTKKLSQSYGFSKWDHSFFWEKKKQVSVMSVIEQSANTDPLGPTTLRKASMSWSELELVQSQNAIGSASQDEGDEGDADAANENGMSSAPAITGPASFAAAIQERFAALMPQEADGSRCKLFSGMSAPELRFTFGGNEDDEGPRIGEKIVSGLEDMGEGIRDAGAKVADGFTNAFDAIKKGITRNNGETRDKSPSRVEGEPSGDSQEESAPVQKPKMVNPFKAVAGAAGAMGGAVGGAMARATSPITRAISPMRGGADNSTDREKGTPDRSNIMSRISNAFQKK